MKKVLIHLVILATFSLVFTGCPKVNEPDSVSTTDDVPQGKEFVRIHKGGEYDGFVEIYFDNYQEQIVKSRNVNVYRKKANTEEWVYLYHFEDSTMLSSIPAVIDYHAEKNVQYSYYLWFNDWYGWQDESLPQTITSKANLPKFKFTQGEASYDTSTMDLFFKTLPELDYSPVGNYFENTVFYVLYSDSFSFNISELADNKFHVRNAVANNYKSCLGKTLSPINYQLGICKYIGSMHYCYWIFEPITQLPSLTIPSELPDISENERFVRKHSGGEYDGFTEIYFDNYEEELLQSSDVYIQRKNANGGWDTVCDIYTEWNGYENPLFTDDLPPVIDYYADEGTEYKYRIHFYHYNSTGDNYDIYTSSQKMTADAGLGKISVTQGTASFNNATGILTFNTLPAFHYTPVNGYFDNTYEQLNYLFSYGNGTSSIYLNINDISDSKLNIYDRINDYWDNERFLGKTWTPGNYYLYLDKYINNYTIRYTTRAEITGLPSLEIPASLPD